MPRILFLDVVAAMIGRDYPSRPCLRRSIPDLRRVVPTSRATSAVGSMLPGASSQSLDEPEERRIDTTSRIAGNGATTE